MTLEELKQLKPGDEIFIRARYKNIEDDGDVEFTHTCTNLDDDVVTTTEYTLPDNVILPPSAPKYDPCRRFKKGDKVRVVERHGRKVWGYDLETIYTVAADEYPPDDPNGLHRGRVGINDGRPETLYSWNIPFYHLELVTPMEELERYVVEPSDVAWFVVDKKHESGEQNVVMYMCALHPNPKAAAEAECARLNAEHRKEKA